MVEQCEGERGPDVGERRVMRCAAKDVRRWCDEPHWRGWKMLSARSAPVMGRGLPRMVDVTMEYVGDD